MTSAGTAPVRVLICDDDPVVRTALTAYIDSDDALQLVAVCDGANQAVASIRTQHVDVALMDIQLQDGDGLSATTRIKQLDAGCKVLLLTALHVADPADGLRAGASGFVMKDVPPKVLCSAIHAVHGGLTVVPSGRHEEVRTIPLQPDAPRLTDREGDVLLMLCDGASTADIAKRLHLSESSVKRDVAALIAALGATSRLHAVVRAHETGLAQHLRQTRRVTR